MKIAYILPSLAPTGPGFVVLDLSRGMEKLGHECCVFYFDQSSQKLNFNCETRKIKFNELFDYENYNVIHSHMFRPDLYVFIHRKHLKKKILITTLHNPISTSALSTVYPFWSSFICSKLWKISIKAFNKIIVLNAITHFELLNQGFKNIQIIYNGRSFNEDHNENETEVSKHIDLFKGDCKLLGTVAGLNKRKGLDQLIRALPKLKGYKLTILGEGPEKQNLLDLAKNLNVEDRVLFTGFIKNPFPLVSKIDVFCLPSYSEGFPLALIEAAILQKPSVLSNIPILESIIPPSCANFFLLNNIDDLVAQIQNIDCRKGSNLFDFYKDNLTLEIMVSNYSELYSNCSNE